MAQNSRPFFTRCSKAIIREASGAIWALLLTAHLAAAQDGSANPMLSQPARAWAVDAANNEISLIQHPNTYLRYRYRTVDEKGDQTRDTIETPEGSVARLIQRNGRPLTTEEDAAERSRLNAILQNPSAFARHIKREQENKKMGVKLIHEMGDAFLWTYAPGQPQLPGQEGNSGALVVLDFKPNPKWSAPDMESEPLTGVEGRAWVDPQARMVVHLEATLTHAVNIGWGMVAHIYAGGTAKVDQANAIGQRWIVRHIVEQLTIRALLVKTVNQRLQFDTSDYQAVKAMNFQEAIKMLLDTPLPQH
ncbi:MAG TPA: hypothetical protein VJU82_10790 [Acidobacteriaceae bacterium]|nr:hypothetical protein [Acidobacteriaceae bacterium]